MPVERTVIEWNLQGSSREELRRKVLLKWAEERCGSSDAYQRYRYNVEKLSGGGSVYLHRPAFKNKGCDFVVNCEPQIPRDDGKGYKNPRHQDLTGELRLLAKHTAGGRQAVLCAAEAVWRCKGAREVLNSLQGRIADPGWVFRAERALKVAKWLFIEQDITDWNTSGRAMLMDGIREALRT